MRISDWSSDVCSSDLLLDREPYPSMRDSPTPPETPEKKQRCPQLWLQPILTEAALASPQASILFEHRFLHLEQDEESVHEIGRAHVRTPVTNAHLVCRLLLEKKNKTM